ncbi:hypothetical protein PWT90_04930 [Aphanocladium album]|nr:hypothetical protein PWT90_04930 [Aphanocladium album]
MNLLPLPFDVRQQIYTELLQSEFHIVLESIGRGQNYFVLLRKHQRFNLHPSVLRISKATYAEAVAVLYSQNSFRLTYPYHKYSQCPSLSPFFRQIGAANSRLIRHLCVALVPLVWQILVGDSWKLSMMADDEATVEEVHVHCPDLQLREVWLFRQTGGRPKRLSPNDWQEGAAKLEYAEERMCAIDEFVLVYSIEGSQSEKCSICWMQFNSKPV